jgi:hypothetical protein
VQVHRKQWRCAVVAFALIASGTPAPLRAQLPIIIPVYDQFRWFAMYEMLLDVKNLTGQVSAALQHVRNAAESLGGGNLVDDILIGQRYLTADIRSIGYGIDTVTTQFEAVFPNREAATRLPPSDVAAVRRGWDDEIHGSGMAAARAQTALSRMETNTQAALDILERSQATTGGTADEGSELAKLQALVQMLGIINSDLTTLATTIAAAERVNTDMVAAETSDDELQAAEAQRMLRDANARQTIPEIDPRILRD